MQRTNKLDKLSEFKLKIIFRGKSLWVLAQFLTDQKLLWYVKGVRMSDII